MALGQTGDAKKDWMAGGSDRAVLKNKFPAGYYRISPTQALYVDPASGSVPKQFIDMLDAQSGDLARDPIPGVPTAYLPDNHVWQEPSYDADARKGLEEQWKLEGQGLTPQQAQDRRLQAQQARPADTYAPGLHNTAGASVGAYERFLAQGGTADMLKMPSFEGYDPERVKTLKDALAENFMQRMGAQQGLRTLRSSQGLDPETGTSTQEMQRLRDTYEGIADPEAKKQWLFYQDPGNLTSELRAARQEARRGERELIAHANTYANEYRYFYDRPQAGGNAFQFVVKKGDVSQTDALGREKFFGNVPLKAELIKPRYNMVGDVAKRLGGGIAGAFLGGFSGGLPGALMGAYQGAGGPMPQVKGFAGGALGSALGYVMGGKFGAVLGGYGGAGGYQGLKKGSASDFSGFGSWRGSGGQIPGGRELGTALVFAWASRKAPAKKTALQTS